MSFVLAISDESAASIRVSGGKGKNTHLLTRLSKQQSGFQVPSTFVLPAAVFDGLVLATPTIQRELHALSSLSSRDPQDPDLRACTHNLQKAIRLLRLPPELKRELGDTFERLGSDIAVRSSATCEDGRQYSAAGQGYTALHQTTLEDVCASVKKVWASLFSPGFIRYREEIGFPHVQARMAVLLQAFINPRASGVAHSFDQGAGRPGYWISAQFGIGEGVVQPISNVDHWFVGPMCEDDDILERGVASKQRRVVIRPQGGTRRQQIHMTAACLDDRMVLKIARAIRAVQQHYARFHFAEDVDVEYAVDEQERLFLVQVRPKWRQKRTRSDGKLVVKLTAVDLLQVPRCVKSVQLSPVSLIAVEGAVTAKLQIDLGSGADGCLPGRVVVAHHTNNEYNAKFGSLLGVITSDGDQTSHAAQHAYEKRIPCVVGAPGAVEALAPYDGKLVTFDASRRTVYLGTVPIVEVQRRQDVWLNERNSIQSAISKSRNNEVFRPWCESKRKRPAVFLEDFEGHFRLRSNTYGCFQLDYYYQAWDRLTQLLNGMFGNRTDRILKAQVRQIKAISAGQCLVHEVRDKDPESIYQYFMSVDDFGTADLGRLFDLRLGGFRRFAAFVHGLSAITRSNVRRVVKELINVFAWMHFGFWLDSVVESFACRQLRYIRNDGSFHNVLRDEAIADLDTDFHVDPKSPWMPSGKLLNLSRQRDKEVFALLERIRSEPRLRPVFTTGRPKAVREVLEHRFPSEFKIISDWSAKYKLTRENLNQMSDTVEYLLLIRKMLRAGSTMPVTMLSVIYQEHLCMHDALRQRASTVLRHLNRRDPQLYLLCRAHARSAVAKQRQVPLSDVHATELGARLPEVVAELHSIAKNDLCFRQAAAAQVLNSNYPSLAAILRISRLQVALREDGHHLIVPHQRRIAQMMLDAAKKFVPQYLTKPEDVFNISTDEFIALFHEPDPRFIVLSLERRQRLLSAEQELQKCWSVSKEDFAGVTPDVDRLWHHLRSEKVGLINQHGALQDKCRALTNSRQMGLDEVFKSDRKAVFRTLRRPLSRLAAGIRKFESCVDQGIRVLERQCRSAQLPGTQAAYRAERIRLRQRVKSLKRKARHEGWM